MRLPEHHIVCRLNAMWFWNILHLDNLKPPGKTKFILLSRSLNLWTELPSNSWISCVTPNTTFISIRISTVVLVFIPHPPFVHGPLMGWPVVTCTATDSHTHASVVVGSRNSQWHCLTIWTDFKNTENEPRFVTNGIYRLWSHRHWISPYIKKLESRASLL